MNAERYAKQLMRMSPDPARALDQFLDYLLDTFEVENLERHKFNFEAAMTEAKAKNIDMFLLMLDWMIEVTEAMINHETLDFFGRMYEEFWKGKSKASALGQFFTPECLCTLMARMMKVEENGVTKYNDCACGSGRTLLAAWGEADWKKLHWFTAEDIDCVSCKMTALNMMIHGMVGRVVQQDTLLLTTPYVIYHVNEVRWPVPTKMYSIRREYPRRETH